MLHDFILHFFQSIISFNQSISIFNCLLSPAVAAVDPIEPVDLSLSLLDRCFSHFSFFVFKCYFNKRTFTLHYLVALQGPVLTCTSRMEKTLYAFTALKHYIFHFLLTSSASIFHIVISNHIGITDRCHRQLSPISVDNWYRPLIN